MQILSLLISFIFGRMNKQHKGIRETAVEIYQDVIEKSRQVVTLTIAGFGALIFFCGGLFIALIDGTTQYDRSGYVAFTSTLGAGLVLVLLASLGFAFVFLKAWPGAERHQTRQKEQNFAPRHEPSSLEQALTALVMDFVKERESKRAASPSTSPLNKNPKTSSSKQRPNLDADPLH